MVRSNCRSTLNGRRINVYTKIILIRIILLQNKISTLFGHGMSKPLNLYKDTRVRALCEF